MLEQQRKLVVSFLLCYTNYIWILYIKVKNGLLGETYIIWKTLNVSYSFNEEIWECKSDSFWWCLEFFSSDSLVLFFLSSSNKILLCKAFAFLYSVPYYDPATFSSSYKDFLIYISSSWIYYILASCSISIERRRTLSTVLWMHPNAGGLRKKKRKEKLCYIINWSVKFSTEFCKENQVTSR